MSRLKITLYENAVGFAEEALRNAVEAEKSPKRWKYAVLSLAQAIELSLKEFLRREHPLFIYSNIDKRGNTVGIEQAKNRIKSIAGVEFTDRDQKALNETVKVRNQIVHCEIDEEVRSLKLNFALLFSFLTKFHNAQLKTPLHKKIRQDLWLAGVKISDYGEELYKLAQDRLQNEGLDETTFLATCPKCSWEATPAHGDNIGECYVCGHFEEIAICITCEKIIFVCTLEFEDLEEGPQCYDCVDYLSNDIWFDMAREDGLV